VCEYVANRLKNRRHCLIVLGNFHSIQSSGIFFFPAEGAGQELIDAGPAEFDASGNRKLGDIAALLRSALSKVTKS
jgi:hypothetical protein